VAPAAPPGVSIFTFVLVKQVKRAPAGAADGPPFLKMSSAMVFAKLPSMSPLCFFISTPITFPIIDADVAPLSAIASITHLQL
jgi:hypothetical protein